MRRRHEIAKIIRESGFIAIVRLNESSALDRVAAAILEGDGKAIEFTLTTPGALDIIRETTKKSGGEVLIGAGTVLDAETARAAILAGAEFIVSPSLNRDVVRLAHRYGKVAIPGTYTPTEIVAALETGADFIKVFPANTLGPTYLKAIKAPLPQAELIPTGGVSLHNVHEFIHAGAAAVAIGGELVSAALVERGDFEAIATKARAFREAILQARANR